MELLYGFKKEHSGISEILAGIRSRGDSLSRPKWISSIQRASRWLAPTARMNIYVLKETEIKLAACQTDF
ncbi:MAG: hypothetical protein ACE14V_04085, partial [bacterium]